MLCIYIYILISEITMNTTTNFSFGFGRKSYTAKDDVMSLHLPQLNDELYDSIPQEDDINDDYEPE